MRKVHYDAVFAIHGSAWMKLQKFLVNNDSNQLRFVHSKTIANWEYVCNINLHFHAIQSNFQPDPQSENLLMLCVIWKASKSMCWEFSSAKQKTLSEWVTLKICFFLDYNDSKNCFCFFNAGWKTFSSNNI